MVPTDVDPRLEVSVYAASADGLYHGRYPNGNAPTDIVLDSTLAAVTDSSGAQIMGS